MDTLNGQVSNTFTLLWYVADIACTLHTFCVLCMCTLSHNQPTSHIAPRGAKKEEAFGGVILKSERPSGALFTNSGPPFFTVESKIEVLSPLGTSFH